ncbi:MAG: 3-methyl-2-oxobutanoate hydroxymethyltransferase [Bosea sp. (in: a-proteobacteria)]
MAYLEDTKPVRLGDFAKMKVASDKITMLTCYDSSFAALLDRCLVDVLLVGDSMGNVLQGHGSTLPVTMEQMIYHTGSVARGTKRALVLADMPFGSYQESPEQAFRNAALLMAAGAHAVKLEGGAVMAPTVHFLVERGIPVCGHIGLTPQSVNQLGGYRVQGKDDAAAKRMMADAKALEAAGAFMMVMEMVPTKLAGEIGRACPGLATIGIGAGPDCAGQVLVLHDMLGIYPGKSPKFTRNFMQGAASAGTGSGSIEEAVKAYVTAVKAVTFPGVENSY